MCINTESRCVRGVVVLVVSVCFIGCEEDLASREHFDTPFSIYGVLSPQLDTQSIRVYPVEDFPTLGSREVLGADVFSTDLTTGDQRAWRDSMVVEPNGQHAYYFWSPFQAEFGHRYLMEVVRRSDGARSFAEVRVPEPVTVRVGDESDARAMQVIIEGEGIRALKPEVVYQRGSIFPDCTVLINRFSYQGHERPVEGGWSVDINLVRDRFGIAFNCGGITTYPTPYCPPAYLPVRAIELHLLVGDAQWDPPAGEFNPNIVSQPNTLTNVENGFGFIGAGYRTIVSFFPSEETLENACFVRD